MTEKRLNRWCEGKLKGLKKGFLSQFYFLSLSPIFVGVKAVQKSDSENPR
ncbi:hypothetical protein C5S36_14410 [Candidatus Methanophagaceae archaeon]|nr:hypothetical protein C5S36_14410 [Methanophagales archaeon]